MAFGQPCLKRLLGFQPEKSLFRLFVRAEKQVDERLAVVFRKDAIADIRPMRGLDFLHHLADLLLVLSCVRGSHSVSILSDDHFSSSKSLFGNDRE